MEWQYCSDRGGGSFLCEAIDVYLWASHIDTLALQIDPGVQEGFLLGGPRGCELDGGVIVIEAGQELFQGW